MHPTRIIGTITSAWILACGSGGATDERADSAGPVLTDIDTSVDADAACAALLAEIDPQKYSRMVTGRCAVDGIIQASNGTTSCDSVQQSCVAKAPPMLGSAARCAPHDFPQCSDVTIRQFVMCSAALVDSGTAYYDYFTCASPISTLAAEFLAPAECEEPFVHCPALSEVW